MKNVAAAVSGPMINSEHRHRDDDLDEREAVHRRRAGPVPGEVDVVAHHGRRFTIIIVRSNEPSPACTRSVSSWLPRSLGGHVVEKVAGDRSPFQ